MVVLDAQGKEGGNVCLHISRTSPFNATNGNVPWRKDVASGHRGLFCSLCQGQAAHHTTPGGAVLLDFGGNGAPWWPCGGVGH